MDALLLCGGFATRLEPITYFIPKPLLPIGVGGKPIIEYIFDDITKSGIKRIIISTNSKYHPYFENWIRNKLNNSSDIVKFVIEPTKQNKEKFGAVRAIAYAIEHAKINEDLFIIACDNFYDFSAKEVMKYFNKHRKPTLALYDVGSKEEAKKFGVVEIKGNRVVSLAEKPSEPKSTLVNIGFYLLPKEYLSKVSEFINETGKTDSIGYFNEWLCKNTEVLGYIYHGKWYDIGTLDIYKKVFDQYTNQTKL